MIVCAMVICTYIVYITVYTVLLHDGVRFPFGTCVQISTETLNYTVIVNDEERGV